MTRKREALPLTERVYNKCRVWFVKHRLPLRELSGFVEREMQVERLKSRVLAAEAAQFPLLRRRLEESERSIQLTLPSNSMRRGQST